MDSILKECPCGGEIVAPAKVNLVASLWEHPVPGGVTYINYWEQVGDKHTCSQCGREFLLVINDDGELEPDGDGVLAMTAISPSRLWAALMGGRPDPQMTVRVKMPKLVLRKRHQRVG